MRALWPTASREQAKPCALRQVKPHITHFCCNQVTLSTPPHIMNWNSLAQFIHILAVVLWIGGIVFMDGFLAPALRRAVAQAQPRAQLLDVLFRNFFAAIWGAGAALVITGYGMVFLRGGFGALSAAQWVMVVLGSAMVLLALYIFFVPFLRMRSAVLHSNWDAACAQAGRIRLLSTVNIVLAAPTILSGVWAVFGPLF